MTISGDIPAAVFQAVLYFLYTDALVPDLARIKDLVAVAEQMKLPRLVALAKRRQNDVNGTPSTETFTFIGGNRGALLSEIKKAAGIGTLRSVVKLARNVKLSPDHAAAAASAPLLATSASVPVPVLAPSTPSVPSTSSASSMAPKTPPQVRVSGPGSVAVAAAGPGEAKRGSKGASIKANEDDSKVPASTLRADLRRMLQSGTCADIEFKARDFSPTTDSGVEPAVCTVQAHRALVCQYEFFRNMLTGSFREALRRTVDLGEDMDVNTLRTMLDWVYTRDRSIVTEDNAMELLAMYPGTDSTTSPCLRNTLSASGSTLTTHVTAWSLPRPLGFRAWLGSRRMSWSSTQPPSPPRWPRQPLSCGQPRPLQTQRTPKLVDFESVHTHAVVTSRPSNCETPSFLHDMKLRVWVEASVLPHPLRRYNLSSFSKKESNIHDIV